ncbi:MAG: glycosyltransferase family 4 protein [Patescibacteria group bacterium]|jgi:glycosyltransferase involved in cell wall biosynthesis
MKICLYLEYRTLFKGRLFKNIGTGLLSSYRNQKEMLLQLGIPFSESSHLDGDILQINTPWVRSLFLMKRARRLGIPVIVWAHVTAEDAREVFRFSGYGVGLLKRYLTYAYGLADVVLCPTVYTRELLIGYGLAPEKLQVQSNAVVALHYKRDEMKRARGRRRYAITHEIAVGTVGLVVPRKGIDTFLFLANHFPSLSFVWFGKQYSTLLTPALPKNLPQNVCFTGYVPDVQEAFSILDIFVFPSREENEGMAILEAAAAGLPILVRDIPVYEGWLEHGSNCLKAKSDEDFARELERLKNDPHLRRELGERAEQLAASLDISKVSEQMLKRYKQSLSIA